MRSRIQYIRRKHGARLKLLILFLWFITIVTVLVGLALMGSLLLGLLR